MGGHYIHDFWPTYISVLIHCAEDFSTVPRQGSLKLFLYGQNITVSSMRLPKKWLSAGSLVSGGIVEVFADIIGLQCTTSPMTRSSGERPNIMGFQRVGGIIQNTLLDLGTYLNWEKYRWFKKQDCCLGGSEPHCLWLGNNLCVWFRKSWKIPKRKIICVAV